MFDILNIFVQLSKERTLPCALFLSWWALCFVFVYTAAKKKHTNKKQLAK